MSAAGVALERGAQTGRHSQSTGRRLVYVPAGGRRAPRALLNLCRSRDVLAEWPLPSGRVTGIGLVCWRGQKVVQSLRKTGSLCGSATCTYRDAVT